MGDRRDDDDGVKFIPKVGSVTVGTIMRFPSGGPFMTVTEVFGDKVTTAGFSSDGAPFWFPQTKIAAFVRHEAKP